MQSEVFYHSTKQPKGQRLKTGFGLLSSCYFVVGGSDWRWWFWWLLLVVVVSVMLVSQSL